MSAPVADPVCLCGDPKSEHRLGRKGCKALDCGCGEFEGSAEVVPSEGFVADDGPFECTCASSETSLSNCEVHGTESTPERLADWEANQAAQCCPGESFMGDPNGLHTFDCPVYQKNMEGLRKVNESPLAEKVAPLRQQPIDLGEPFMKSTSARLREVEREVVDAREELDRRLSEALIAKTNAEAKAKKMQRLWEICSQDRDRVIADRDALAARVAELEALLEQAEQFARDLQDNGDVAPAEIHGWDAWQCFTCGSRYRRDFDHEHGPLKPVRVSITER